MKRKYLDDIGIEHKDTPQGWEDTPKLRKQRKIYGFDARETYSLDYTFEIWLYERLMMYNEVNIVDTKAVLIDIGEKRITLQECIDMMLDGLRNSLSKEYYRLTDEKKAKADSVVKIFAACYRALWW